MAKRRTYTVNTDSPSHRLNVRKEPTIGADVLTLLNYGEKVKIDPDASTKEWALLDGGGYVMRAYLK